jgi:tetratricopeptide (TPR) repeat protein
MKKLVLSLVAVILVGYGLSRLASEETLSANRAAKGEASADLEEQGEPLPYNTTVERKVIDEDTGEEKTWKLTKRYIPREELPDRVLPSPHPRETEANAETESARALDGMALESWKHGNIARAMELFEEAVKSDPDDARAHSDYGRLLTLMVAYDKAYPHLERAAELTPDDPTVWLDLQTLYERDSQFERAGHAGKRAQTLAGDREIVKDEQGFYRLEGHQAIP